MRKILVTGGTVFVSRYVAQYFAQLGDDVYVLNRNTRPQPPHTTLIEADRHNPGDILKPYHFDAVLDICAYTSEDVSSLVTALGTFDDYILISSSAVYPETLPMPLKEEFPVGRNNLWGDYGAGKISAEITAEALVPNAYILRPPYLYGPMQNLYREPFVFDCAQEGRIFVLPPDRNLSLQFFHIGDLCRFMNIILTTHPEEHVFNVGNPETVSVSDWVQLCYEAAGEEIKMAVAPGNRHIRSYFCFNDYNYSLDVSRQLKLMPDITPLQEGLKESFDWYRNHKHEVIPKPYSEYIDKHISVTPSIR